MAELTGQEPLEEDLVTCECGQQWDRNIYSQCKECFCDLWQLDRTVSPTPPVSGSAGHTLLESESRPTASIDILVCGERITVSEGQSLRLGRQDDFETAHVFRDAPNVSRRHAVLRFEGGRLHVTDTNSSNKTFVNGHELPPGHEYEIKRGQQLRLASNVPVEIVWDE